MNKSKIIIAILILAALFRLVALDKYPAGLNADEASLGYNAWSLIETGKDEHSVSWPLVFRSFDDYKPPLYAYLTLPFIKVLGLTVTAVRLPSAILGTLSVLLLYYLTKRLFPKKGRSFLPEIASLILAISPWHLHFSRGGWEVNVATFFMLLTLLFLHKAYDDARHLFVFAVSAVLSLYTYHSARVITPLLIISFSIIYFQKTKILFDKKNIKIALSAFILAVVLAGPIAFQMLSKEGQSRFSGVSIFADSGPVWQATNYRIEHTDENLTVRLIHNQYVAYGLRFTQNYLSHYSLDFLFLNGDVIDRSRVPEVGENLLIFLPFFIIGLLFLLRLNNKGKRVIVSWFLIAPVAASLTYQSPHALRAENMAIPCAIIIALGLDEFIKFAKKNTKKIFVPLATIIVIGTLYSFGRYLHMYYLHYPKEIPVAWQYGFDQIAKYTKENYDKYDRIIITDRYDQPYILIAFFSKYPPKNLQTDVVMSPPDNYGFSTGRKLGKYEFRSIKYEEDKNLPNTLLISADEDVDDSKVINTVKSLSGKVMFKFIATDEK